MKDSQHRKRVSLFWFVVTVVFPIHHVSASSTCYNEASFPNITEIREGSHGLEFVAAGVHLDNDTAPVITLTNDTAWDSRTWEITKTEKCKIYGCVNRYTACDLEMPKITLSVRDALNLRSFSYEPDVIEQKISSCSKDGDNIYFGISFYSGEGVSGVGGIGRYNTITKAVEVRYLPILRDSSVTHVAFDGKLLWIASAHHYECEGTPPSIGLIKYDWDENEIDNSYSFNFGVCGFVVHDIHITDTSIWIATDLGLSQAYRSKEPYRNGWEGGWRNYVPQTDQKEVMKKVWCRDLYNDLLDNLPRNDNPIGDSSYVQFFNSLAKYRSHILLKYVEKIKKAANP